MTPESPRSSREPDTKPKNEIRNDVLDKKADQKPDNPRYDVDVYRVPSDEQRQVETKALLGKLNLESEFGKVLNAEEMKTLRISVDQGHALEVYPPIYTGSVGVSFVRDGKRVTIEEGMRWQGERNPAGPQNRGMMIDSGESSDTADVRSASEKGIPDALVSNALLKIVARIAGNQLAEKTGNLDDLLEGDTKPKNPPKGPNEKPRNQLSTAAELKEAMDRIVENVDGEKVLREAASKLSKLDSEVFEAGMKGPPPVDGKVLGSMIAKSTVSIAEIGKFLRNKYESSSSMKTAIDAVIGVTETPEFILADMVRYSMESGQKTLKTPGESGLTAEENAFIKELVANFNEGVKPEEAAAQSAFEANALRFVEQGVKEGRTFISKQEQKEKEAGGGYMMEWVLSRTFERTGLYRDIEESSKTDRSPVTVRFEKSKTNDTPKPILTLTPKPGRDAKALAQAIGKEIGVERIVDQYGSWQIKDITTNEIGKILRLMEKQPGEIRAV